MAICALALLLFAGCTCGVPCGPDGICDEGQSCSLVWNRCLDTDRVFGNQCIQPNECHRGVCFGTPGSPSLCTSLCAPSDPPCPGGWACVPVGDGAGGVVPVCAPAGDAAIGTPCVADNACSGALCLRLESGDICSASCDAAEPRSCGEGNVGCVTFADGGGNTFDFCVSGGSTAPGAACPGGILDCDLARSAACLEDSSGGTLCAPACPGGDDACGELPGGCCVDLGAETPAPFCLPAIYCGCVPSCIGARCGDDGCGGSCGSCGAGEVCTQGVCNTCTPLCEGLLCGDDGCGGVCGTCRSGERCVSGLCEASCTPSCADAVCGGDGCGGLCGACAAPTRCHAGACVPPELLLVDIQVDHIGQTPAPIWGLGEYLAAPSIGPPVVYGQGPAQGTSQVRLCGNTIVCSDEAALSFETGYALWLGYDLGAGRQRCTASFTLHATGAPSVDGGDCLQAQGGPFATIEVGGLAATPTLGWTLP